MRSTQRQVQQLMREARRVLGLRRNRDVFAAIIPIQQAVERHLGESVAIVGPYRLGCWSVYWLDGLCERSRVFEADDLGLTPEAFVERVFGLSEATGSCRSGSQCEGEVIPNEHRSLSE